MRKPRSPHTRAVCAVPPQHGAAAHTVPPAAAAADQRAGAAAAAALQLKQHRSRVAGLPPPSRLAATVRRCGRDRDEPTERAGRNKEREK
jgi:succinylarginine dihydrolase